MIATYRKLLDLLRQTFRNDQPSQAPPCHPKVFRETVDHEHIAAPTEYAAAWLVIHQSLIDLVDDQCAAMVRHDVGQGIQFGVGDQCAGRI